MRGVKIAEVLRGKETVDWGRGEIVQILFSTL